MDFRKAYDTINRSLLWSKLESIGICGKMLTAIHDSVKRRVRINGHMTDWFNVHSGILSPLIFNVFVNDLGTLLELSGKGVSLDGIKLSIFFYAVYLLLRTEKAEDLQQLLDISATWCNRNMMQIN